MRLFGLFLALVLFILISVSSYAGFWDSIGGIIKEVKEGPGQQAVQGALSEKDIALGLKEALKVGVQRAVKAASKQGGFLDNPQIRIPLPSKLQTAASVLKRTGFSGQVDAFEKSMNEAAEQASKQALSVFTQAIRELTIKDVKRLWKGGDMAITEYFREKTWPTLYKKFLPIVDETVNKVGVTQKYKQITSNTAIQPLLKGTSLDLDNYVTQKALDGLFILLGNEEAKIRKDPAARTTELLKKVFG